MCRHGGSRHFKSEPLAQAAMPSKLGPFEVGQIFALHREDYSFSFASIGAAVRRLEADACATAIERDASSKP